MPRIINCLGPMSLTDVYTTELVGFGPSDAVFDVIRQIHVVNVTGSAETFRLYLGAPATNAAGTELFYDQPVPPYSVYDWQGLLQLGLDQSLVGGASANNALTITIAAEVHSVE